MKPVLLHGASTLALVGLIWLVQLVQYPLFARVGREAFTGYHAAHSRQITWVVAPLMLCELITGVWLLFDRPAAVPAPAIWIGLGLIGLIWLSTAFLQVPAHATLAQGFDAETHRSLVRTNWVRTCGWTLRGMLVLWMFSRLPRPE